MDPQHSSVDEELDHERVILRCATKPGAFLHVSDCHRQTTFFKRAGVNMTQRVESQCDPCQSIRHAYADNRSSEAAKYVDWRVAEFRKRVVARVRKKAGYDGRRLSAKKMRRKHEGKSVRHH